MSNDNNENNVVGRALALMERFEDAMPFFRVPFETAPLNRYTREFGELLAARGLVVLGWPF